MDSAFSDIIKAILSSAGLSGAIALLLVLVIAYQYREHQKEGREWDAERTALSDKRLDELRQTLAAIQGSAATMTALTVSVDARNAVLADLAKGFSTLVQGTEASRERFTELGKRIEDSQKEILTLLRTRNGGP